MGGSQSRPIHPLEIIYGIDTGSTGSDWQYDPDWETWGKEVKKKKNLSQPTKQEEEDKEKEASQSGDLGESVHSLIDLEEEGDVERKERKRKLREWKQSKEYQNSLLITRPESTLGVLGHYERESPLSAANKVHAVEKIIARRTSIQGVNYFLVKWRDCSTDHNTWESEDNLVGCEDALHEFIRERRERKRKKRELWSHLFPQKLKD